MNALQNAHETINQETLAKNTPEQRIQELIRENHELTVKLQRAHWKNRNQRNEIKRLNSAILFRNNLVRKRDEAMDAIMDIHNKVQG